MAGRFVHFVVAGAAIVGGMAVQGDLDRGSESSDRDTDRHVDRIVDRATDNIVLHTDEGKVVDSATKRALAAAVAELVRAEGRLITARMDEDLPAAVVTQVEQRRDAARQTVDRIAADIGADTRDDRDDLRREIREEVRDAVRS